MGLRRAQRLRSPAQFRRAFAQGQTIRCGELDIRVWWPPREEAAPRPSPRGLPPVAGQRSPEPDGPTHPARLGIVVRRAVVKSSVRRNQWKRWIREAFRRHQAAIPCHCDIVVHLRQDTTTADYALVERTLVGALQQVARSTQDE